MRLTKRITLALLCCSIGALVWFGGRSLMAREVADIPAVKISPLDEMSPCIALDRLSYEKPVVNVGPATYTATAQKRGINGEVRLFAYLNWTGEVSGIAVISSLPQGLTREAIKAAKAIKFVPARTCGQALTEPVEIHYDFPSGRGKLVRL